MQSDLDNEYFQPVFLWKVKMFVNNDNFKDAIYRIWETSLDTGFSYYEKLVCLDPRCCYSIKLVRLKYLVCSRVAIKIPECSAARVSVLSTLNTFCTLTQRFYFQLIRSEASICIPPKNIRKREVIFSGGTKLEHVVISKT